MNKSIYDFSAKSNDGKEINLSQYKGKVLLIVNVASYCGYTPQYKGLQELYMKYKDQGLEIIGFPCNQFGAQEPGSNEDIQKFCTLNYGVTFRIFDKIEVNGEKAHPLYKYLTKELSALGSDDIKWNFTKFLVDKEGNVVDRFPSKVTPAALSEQIEKLLK
ncbi:MAG: glutathione peroxidase [Candidatus Kapabacteria bacterium]|nr:glutathione peroxidase [Candidatus Kapabacteria bacterium]